MLSRAPAPVSSRPTRISSSTCRLPAPPSSKIEQWRMRLVAAASSAAAPPTQPPRRRRPPLPRLLPESQLDALAPLRPLLRLRPASPRDGAEEVLAAVAASVTTAATPPPTLRRRSLATATRSAEARAALSALSLPQLAGLLYGLVALGLRRGGDCDAEFLAAATEAAADRLEERRRRDDADANACSSDSSALGLELDACWALAVACARLGHRDPRLLQAIALSVAESVERASAAANVGPSFSSSPSLLTSAKRAAGLAALAEAFAVQRAHSPKLMMALREAFRARNGYLARRLPTAVEASAALWGLFFSFREVDGDHSREDAALAALLGERVAALGPQLPLRQLARVFATLAGVVVGGGGRGTSAASSAAASAAVASLCSSLRPPQLRRMRAAELAAVVVAVSVTLMRRRVEEEQDEEEDEEQQQQPPPPPPPVLLRRFLQDCALAARNRLHTCSPRDLVALLEAFALCGHRSGLLVAYAERTLLVVGTRGGGPASASGAVAVVDSLPLPLLARLAAALAALAAGGGSSADGDETTALSRRSKRRLRAAGGDVERRGEASAAADQERHRRRRRRLAVVSAIARRGVEAVKEVRGGGADEAADDDDAALLLRALVALVGEEEEDEEDDEGEGEGNDDGKDAAAARQLQALADALGDSGFVAPTSSFSSTLDQWRRLLAEQARMITDLRARDLSFYVVV